MRVNSSELSNMDKIAFRVSLIIAFVLKFIEAVVRNNGTPSMKRTIDFNAYIYLNFKILVRCYKEPVYNTYFTVYCQI